MKKLILMSLMIASAAALAVEPEDAEKFSKELDAIQEDLKIECDEPMPVSMKKNALILQAASSQKLNVPAVLARLADMPEYASVKSVIDTFGVSAQTAEAVLANKRSEASNPVVRVVSPLKDPCIQKFFHELYEPFKHSEELEDLKGWLRSRRGEYAYREKYSSYLESLEILDLKKLLNPKLSGESDSERPFLLADPEITR